MSILKVEEEAETTIVALLATVDKSQVGVATGFVFIWRCLGQCFGVGISQAIFQTALSVQLQKRISDPEVIDRIRHSTHSIFNLPLDTRQLAVAGFKVAVQQTFYFAAAGAGIVLLTSFFVSTPLSCCNTAQFWTDITTTCSICRTTSST